MDKMFAIVFFRDGNGKLVRCETRQEFDNAMRSKNLTLLLGYPLDKLEEEYAAQQQ